MDGRKRQAWSATAESVLTGMEEWRAQHPTATFKQIETELDDRLAVLRTRMLQDALLASAARTIAGTAAAERPRCPQCQGALTAQGRHTRVLTTHRDHALHLDREYARCSACGAELFPPG